MTYIVMQRKKRTSYTENTFEPIGEFVVSELSKVTAKCIFVKRRWSDERFIKDDFYYQIFDDKESAEKFVSVCEASSCVPGYRYDYEQAKQDMRDASDTYSSALRLAGQRNWKELTNDLP